jgi:hypothetical protein
MALWAYTLAEGPLTIADPGPITEKKNVKVTDPNSANRVFDPAKFTKATADPAIVTVAKPTTNDATFALTPLKSGKAKLSIEYVDGDTTLKGTIDLVVPYEEFEIKGAGAQPLKFFVGQNKPFTVFGVGVDGSRTKITEAEASSADPNIVTPSFLDQQLKLEAKNAGTTEVRLGVLGVVSEPIKVEVKEGITKIEIDNRGVVGSGDVQVVMPEGETRQVKVRLIGSKGTEFKRSDFPALQTTVGGGGGQCIPIQAAYDDKDENVLVLTTPPIVAGCPSAERTVTLKVPAGPLAETDVTTTIRVAITQRIGFIKLTTTSPVLSQNSKISVTAEVFNRNNTLISPSPDVTFALSQPVKDSVWVSLVKEGNKATLVSRNPSQKEIKDKNDGELVPRPSEVVVIAKAKPDATSPEVESSIAISLAEVVGFDLLKVKLNVMDERTAADLYGKVTSDEYYVLSVRLFNNLKDERTGEFSGNSILAYSSSIEVAVQLEKRFDRSGSNSYFPNIVSKSEANSLVDNTGRIAAARQAQTDLNTALNEQYTTRQDAIRRVNDAMVKRTRAEKLTALARATTDSNERRQAFNAANAAINDYNGAWVEAHAALERASASEDQVNQYRARIAREALNRAADTQSYFNDPDTAIDDGKWHPMSPADLVRLGSTPLPNPATPRPASGPLATLTDTDFRARPRRAAAFSAEEEPEPEDEETDPPCRGVITYRPFTFEMMVNTVDRRDGRSLRSKIFKVLDLVGTGTSFVTAVAVPGPSSDLPLGLEKFSNLLLPGLDKLYPNYKEQQRQNIVSQAMKEIEEIPFASDITRVIFIPKRNIHGLVRGHDARISEICPFFFRIQVAIVSKKADTQQGVIR